MCRCYNFIGMSNHLWTDTSKREFTRRKMMNWYLYSRHTSSRIKNQENNTDEYFHECILKVFRSIPSEVLL